MSSRNREHEFWTSDHRYEDLARKFEQGIVRRGPRMGVTSERMCPCLEYSNYCLFPLEGKVEYIEYRGEAI